MGEIDEHHFFFLGDEKVEFVEVTVNQSIATQFHYQMQEGAVHFARIREFHDLIPALSFVS